MLSNTAIPYYYGQFRDAVWRGEIPICKEIEMQMCLIDKLIADPRYYYDPMPVEKWIKYCEKELTLRDGGELHLMDSFKLWAEDIFGWYEFIERDVYVPYKDGPGGRYVRKKIKMRVRRKQYLIVARGAAKSMYESCIHSYFLNIDPDTTYQVTTSPTVMQSNEILAPIKTSITRARGPLFKFLTEGSLQNTTGNRALRQKLFSSKKGIENTLTGSLLEIRPLSIDKLQGLNCKVATVDEWLSGVLREDPIGALEQGASKGGIEDYIIIATSSEGTVRNGAGDSIKMELSDILQQKEGTEGIAPMYSIWWYKLDSLDEVERPEMWKKANPNIGITVSYDVYQQDKDKSEISPAAKNDILAKRFGIPCEGFTYFFTWEEIQPHHRQDFWQMPCSMGADLSRGGDFCSFVFFFPLSGGRFGVKTVNYISDVTMCKLPIAMRSKYDEFVREGSLFVLDGTILDMNDVYDDLDRVIESRGYDVRTFGYDPYNAREFVERWCRENGEFGVEKVIQGTKTESVPLTELKKLAEERLLLFDEALMEYTMGNAIVSIDTNGGKKLMKKDYESKIDAVAAMMDAFVAYKLNKDAFE